MSIIPVNIAVEDRLSEAVIRRVLRFANAGYCVGMAYGRSGYGYLRSTIHGWNAAAVGVPFVLLTDLDQYPCASALILDWLHVPLHENLLFRIAVREVESWLLADHVNLADHLKISAKLAFSDPDDLPDPKATLIALAEKSRSREIRSRLVPKRGSTARVGPDYNGCLIEFVNSTWDVNVGADCSPSLARAVNRLRNFEPRWPAPE